MTHPIRTGELPPASLLLPSRDAGAFADCYVCEVDGQVSHAAFVEAFYTTPLFKLERTLLHWLARRPATDADAHRLAQAESNTFSAWRVETRAANQLLLADFTGRTKSWLMAEALPQTARPPQTRLYFGSAVVPKKSRSGGPPRMGFGFHALLGFHRLYSRLLLGAARSRLQRLGRAGSAPG
jgi:hypothetical protein